MDLPIQQNPRLICVYPRQKKTFAQQDSAQVTSASASAPGLLPNGAYRRCATTYLGAHR